MSSEAGVERKMSEDCQSTGGPQEAAAAVDVSRCTSSGTCPCANSGTTDDCHCTKSETIDILCQFEQTYMARVAEVDADCSVSPALRDQLKLKIMTDWVKDLGEQNTVLVQTVHDLEQAAVCRVKLLENKLQVTSNLMSHNMMNSDKSEQELNALSNRICQLVNSQDDMQIRIDHLQCDVDSLLELIKRGRTENNWNLDGIRFYEIDPSNIPGPLDCSCDQISSVLDNGECELIEKNNKLSELYEKLHKTEAKLEELMHEYDCRIKDLQMNFEEKCRENRNLVQRLACLEKESSDSCAALTKEVADKHDSILVSKKRIEYLENELTELNAALQFKEDVIREFRARERKNTEKAPAVIKKVRINVGSDEKINEKNEKQELYEALKQLEEVKNTLVFKDNEISKLRTLLSEKSNQEGNSSNCLSPESQIEILSFLTNLLVSLSKDNETILSLQVEYETVLKNLKQTKNIYEKNVALVNEKLHDIESCLQNYRSQVIEQNQCCNTARESISIIENKLQYVQSLFDSKCEMCLKEDLRGEMEESVTKVSTGIQTLSDVHENLDSISSSIKNMLGSNSAVPGKSASIESEQKAIFSAIVQQFRMMEEFRVCTVEVQAATEDLREEMSEVVSNLDSRHCKYVELSKMVSQVQDYLIRTTENISEVISCLELQEQERSRHTERITNNRIRLKDMKNEFNQTQLELSKCLNNVHNNVEQSNLVRYADMQICNDLLVSVVEEVEQIVSNLHVFESPGCCSSSTMTELKKKLIVIEHNMKEFQKKMDQVLSESEVAQKLFVEKSKRLEKYECEVDECHTKMQDTLESIIAMREQMNEFGCIRDIPNSFQSTNETTNLISELQKSRKECEEWKRKATQESCADKQNETVLHWENRILDFQDQIKLLRSEVKCKQEANNYLKQSIESLENELESARGKAEDYRKCSSIGLRNKVLELENFLRIQKDEENNLKCSGDNEIASKTSLLLDFVNKDLLEDGTTSYGSQASHENVPQLLKHLQDTIQVIKIGLKELSDEFKRLATEGSFHRCISNDAVRGAIEVLAKYIESIKHCSFEIEKIKTVLYSKDKLMENMDEIIRIQKDSITISQSEVEDLHKTLQEKINAQENVILQCEEEKRHLNETIELQVQTIGHLQGAVVEAKKTIDQLSNKAASDNYKKSQVIRTLNLYLTETQSQYNECYGEASEQGALLELQRDAISTLQKKIRFLECDELLNAFMLHFIYYIILQKYKDGMSIRTQELNDMKSKVDELSYEKDCLDEQCSNLNCKYQEANEVIGSLRGSFEDTRIKLISEKQAEMDALLSQNADLKKQLQVYKLDFELIQEEMKKMGIVEECKLELETMRSENERLREDLEKSKKVNDDLNISNRFLSEKLQNLKAATHKYKEKIICLQEEVTEKDRKIKLLITQNDKNEALLCKQSGQLEDLRNKSYCNEHRMKSTIDDLQEKINLLGDCNSKLRNDIGRLKAENQCIKADLFMQHERLSETNSLRQQLEKARDQLVKIQESHERVSQELERHQEYFIKVAQKRQKSIECLQTTDEICHLTCKKKNEEVTKKMAKEMNDIREKLNSKSAELTEIKSKFTLSSNKYESNFQRQKDEIMLLEKRLTCYTQKFQNCKEKNEDLIRQNKALEDNNNKCMVELQDIILQLEDMQSSLVDLRTECDSKSQSLDCVSTELAKIKVSRSEIYEESKAVLEWARYWMKQQKEIANTLQDKLREKQQLLIHMSSQKKNFACEIKRLRRKNIVLTKRLKFIRKPSMKPNLFCAGDCPDIQRNYLYPIQQEMDYRNSFYSTNLRSQESNAVYSHFKNESKGVGLNSGADKITAQGDSRWFPVLEHFAKEVPRTSQTNEKKHYGDSADGGYQTSCSK